MSKRPKWLKELNIIGVKPISGLIELAESLKRIYTKNAQDKKEPVKKPNGIVTCNRCHKEANLLFCYNFIGPGWSRWVCPHCGFEWNTEKHEK